MKKIKIAPKKKKLKIEEFDASAFAKEHRRGIIVWGSLFITAVFLSLGVWMWRGRGNMDVSGKFRHAQELFIGGEYKLSLDIYKGLGQKLRGGELAPAALLGEGYCYMELGDYQKAQDRFTKIRKRFPESLWRDEAEDAIERING